MKPIVHIEFPNESPDYRRARNALLDDEMALRRQIEQIAARRRTLPAGGAIPEDYVFERAGGDGRAIAAKFSDLFDGGKDTLGVYSFMFGPELAQPCAGCTHFLDSLDGAASHIVQRVNLAIVAKSPLSRILDFARTRGWRHLPLLSTAGNRYDRDYFGDSTALPKAVRVQQDFKDGEEWDMPMLNIFVRDRGMIRHFWGSELLYVPSERNQEYRHNDLLDPLWNLFDLTPAGRNDFEPKLEYGSSNLRCAQPSSN